MFLSDDFRGFPMIDSLVICGNNIMRSVIFFGSNDIEDLNEFCSFTGAMRFLTEFSERSELWLEIMSFVNDTKEIKEFHNSHSVIWSSNCPGVDADMFAEIVFGTWNEKCTDKTTWYIYLYLAMFRRSIENGSIKNLRDFERSEIDDILLINSSHTPNWEKLIASITCGEDLNDFIKSEDESNGFYD